MSRGMQLVAIRMSQACEMPSTLVNCGVSSVMAWTTSTKPRAVSIVKMRTPNSSNAPDVYRLADAADRQARVKHPLTPRKFLVEFPILFRADLARQTIGEIGPPQIVVQEDDQLQRAAIGIGMFG